MYATFVALGMRQKIKIERRLCSILGWQPIWRHQAISPTVEVADRVEVPEVVTRLEREVVLR